LLRDLGRLLGRIHRTDVAIRDGDSHGTEVRLTLARVLDEPLRRGEGTRAIVVEEREAARLRRRTDPIELAFGCHRHPQRVQRWLVQRLFRMRRLLELKHALWIVALELETDGFVDVRERTWQELGRRPDLAGSSDRDIAGGRDALTAAALDFP